MFQKRKMVVYFVQIKILDLYQSKNKQKQDKLKNV